MKSISAIEKYNVETVRLPSLLRVVLFCLFFALSTSAFAQSKYSISGILMDDSTAVENVAVKVFADSVLMDAVISDKNGNFVLANLTEGTYQLQVISLFYEIKRIDIDLKQDIRLGHISLQKNVHMLEVFSIEEKVNPVEMTNYGVVLNIANTLLSDFGNVLDLINYAPVSFINTSQFNNNGGLEILINGKKANIPAGKQDNFLKSISSQNVQKIEIIDKPDASIDANKKGSVNIILKSQQGVMGEMSANVGYHQLWEHWYDVSLFYNASKFRLFTMLELDFKHHKNKSNTEELRNDINFNTSTLFEVKAIATDFMFGGDYFINEKSSIGILYTLSNENQYFTNIKNIYSILTPYLLEDSIIFMENNHDHNDVFHAITANYDLKTDTLGSKFTTSFDWGGYFDIGKVLKNYQFYKDKVAFENATVAGNLDFLEDENNISNLFAYNARFDKNFKNRSAFTIGTKWSYTKYKSNNDFFDIINDVNNPNSNNSYSMDFNEYVGAVFTGYKISHKKHFFNISLRGEFNYNKYKNNDENYGKSFNWAILPTFLHDITINDNNNIYYYFTQRTFRPDFVNYISNASYDPISQTYGNSKLKPNEYYIFRVGYTFRQRYAIVLNANHANNLILSIPTLQDGKVIYNLTNSGLLNYIGLIFSIPINIGNWWEMQNNISGGYRQNIYKNNLEKIAFQGFNCDISHYSYFYLPKRFSLFLNYSYTSPYVTAFYKYKDVHNLGVGIRYRINDSFILSLSCSDILNSARTAYSFEYQDVFKGIYASKSLSSKTIWFKFVYSFEAGKAVDSFEKSTGVETEKGRLMR
jgi:hypothetical protein